MLTLSLIQEADPDAVVASLNSGKSVAANWVSVADRYRTAVGSPAGQEWTGRTAQAAYALASADRSAVDTGHSTVVALADKAIQDIQETVQPALAEVRRIIDETTSSGFTVNDDLSVSYGEPCPSQTAQADAERQARLIQAAARKWWAAEQSVGDQITTSGQNLAIEFKQLVHNIDWGAATVTFYSGTMSTLGLELRRAATAPGKHLPRALPHEILNPHQYGRHAVDVPPRRAHAKIPTNAAAMSRAGKILGPVGVAAGTAYEVYDDFKAYRNGTMSGSEAAGKGIGALGGGVAGGALAGAAVGSFFGPVGTAVGAGIGAAVGSELGGRFGKWVGGLFH